jgi:hypothetical protein
VSGSESQLEALRRPRIRVSLVIALAVAVGVVIWLVIAHERGGGSSNQSTRAAPEAASVAQLKAAAATLGPIAWVGPRAGSRYELTWTPAGRTYVRYLTGSAKIGDPRPDFLTVGTYRQAGAYAAVQAAARQPGAVRVTTPNGIAFYNRSHPTSVYVGLPGAAYQIEVFSPLAGESRRLVESGQVRLVGTTPTAAAKGPVAATPAMLRAASASRSAPLYWAGERSGTTYELTDTVAGRTYVRYLPKGTPVGSPRPDYLSVGTYTVPNALVQIRALASRPGSVRIPLANGGVAVYTKSRPTSVYLAYPGAPYEIEVYDPNAATALQLVTSGKIVPVG